MANNQWIYDTETNKKIFIQYFKDKTIRLEATYYKNKRDGYLKISGDLNQFLYKKNMNQLTKMKHISDAIVSTNINGGFLSIYRYNSPIIPFMSISIKNITHIQTITSFEYLKKHSVVFYLDNQTKKSYIFHLNIS